MHSQYELKIGHFEANSPRRPRIEGYIVCILEHKITIAITNNKYGEIQNTTVGKIKHNSSLHCQHPAALVDPLECSCKRIHNVGKMYQRPQQHEKLVHTAPTQLHQSSTTSRQSANSPTSTSNSNSTSALASTPPGGGI